MKKLNHLQLFENYTPEEELNEGFKDSFYYKLAKFAGNLVSNVIVPDKDNLDKSYKEFRGAYNKLKDENNNDGILQITMNKIKDLGKNATKENIFKTLTSDEKDVLKDMKKIIHDEPTSRPPHNPRSERSNQGMKRRYIEKTHKKVQKFPCVFAFFTQELEDRKKAKGQGVIGILPDGYRFRCEDANDLRNYRSKYKKGGTYNGETITVTTVGPDQSY